jgi:hypothetical protein
MFRLAFHINVFEEVIDAIIGEDFDVEEIDGGIDSGFSANLFIE